MRPIFIGSLMIFTGLVFGVTLTEISLRIFMPELSQQQNIEDSGYIKNLTAKSDAPLNEQGFREADTLADLDENSWIVIGGSTAFGLGVADDKRFTEQAEKSTGLKFYNAAQVGKGGDMAFEFAAVKRLKSKADKLVYVIDMGIPPYVMQGVEPADDLKHGGLLNGLVLKKVLFGKGPMQSPKIAAWTQQEVTKYVRNLASIASKYRTNDEHFIVLVMPARGHWLQNSYGTIHRKNQELMTNGLRMHQGIYAVDLSFLAKMDYVKPAALYNEYNRANEKGHRVLADGFLKQFETFSTWRSFDELTPEEQEKVREDMRKNEEQEAEKRAKNPF